MRGRGSAFKPVVAMIEPRRVLLAIGALTPPDLAEIDQRLQHAFASSPSAPPLTPARQPGTIPDGAGTGTGGSVATVQTPGEVPAAGVARAPGLSRDAQLHLRRNLGLTIGEIVCFGIGIAFFDSGTVLASFVATL